MPEQSVLAAKGMLDELTATASPLRVLKLREVRRTSPTKVEQRMAVHTTAMLVEPGLAVVGRCTTVLQGPWLWSPLASVRVEALPVEARSSSPMAPWAAVAVESMIAGSAMA